MYEQDKSVIKKSLSLLKKGYSKREVCEKLNVSITAIGKWMVKYNVEDISSPRLTRLSSLQRRSIALQILQGSLTISEANVLYQIRGHDTIAKWIRLIKEENIDISTLKADIVQEEDLTKPVDGELEALKKSFIRSSIKNYSFKYVN